jgi:MFS family permease
VFLPLFLVNVIGVSATGAGVSLIPVSVGLASGAAITGQLVSRFGHYRLQMLIGGALLTAGLFLLSRMSGETSYWQVTLYMTICGLGLGPTFPLYTLAIQNAMEPRYIGQATSTSIFFRQIGGTVSAAIMGTVLAGVLATSLAGLPRFGARTGAGDPPSTAGALSSASPAQIGQLIRADFDHQYALVERVYRYRDFQALEQLLVNPQLPAQAKAQLKAWANRGSPQPGARGSEQALAAIKVRLTQQADLVAAAVLRTLKAAFARSVTQIFFYSIFIVLAAWVMTLFIPELPLRRTQEQSEAAAAG